MMKPVGIYIHVPFCRSKCPYCDFYSVRLSEEMLTAYTDETIRRLRELKPEGIAVDTVYFGGGTPSLLGGRNIARILDALGESVCICGGAEITAEANPSADLSGFLREAAFAGVNRLSLGMQSAVPQELAAIGRTHSQNDILKAVEAARLVGIENISLDLMLGIPHQTVDSLGASLAFIKQCAPAHVSAYMLKIEQGTPFFKRKDSLDIPDDDTTAELYEQAFDALRRMGYERYEISNAAREGAVSRHNLKYWNCDEYIGLGPSAHSFFHGKRYYFRRSLSDYLDGVSPAFDCIGGTEEEYVMLRLRLAEGLHDEGMTERFGHAIPRSMCDKANFLAKVGLCVYDGKSIRLTGKGMLLSNAVICELLGE